MERAKDAKTVSMSYFRGSLVGNIGFNTASVGGMELVLHHDIYNCCDDKGRS